MNTKFVEEGTLFCFLSRATCPDALRANIMICACNQLLLFGLNLRRILFILIEPLLTCPTSHNRRVGTEGRKHTRTKLRDVMMITRLIENKIVKTKSAK